MGGEDIPKLRGGEAGSASSFRLLDNPGGHILPEGRSVHLLVPADKGPFVPLIVAMFLDPFFNSRNKEMV